jgi:hypothetical protein
MDYLLIRFYYFVYYSLIEDGELYYLIFFKLSILNFKEDLLFDFILFIMLLFSS